MGSIKVLQAKHISQTKGYTAESHIDINLYSKERELNTLIIPTEIHWLSAASTHMVTYNPQGNNIYKYKIRQTYKCNK